MVVMYSKEILKGIIIGNGKTLLNIYRDDRRTIGYSVKIAFGFRGSDEFLERINRSLLQHNIVFTKPTSKQPFPLSTRRKENQSKIISLLGDIPLSKDLELLKDLLDVQNSNMSKLEKFEKIIEIQGESNGTNEYEYE